MEPDFCYTARALRVIDGDTLDVEVDLGFRVLARMPLRIAHINAPEHNTPEGPPATAHLAQLLGALPAPIVVHTFKPVDKYGRYLADVYNDQGVDVGADMVANGFAVPYEGGPR